MDLPDSLGTDRIALSKATQHHDDGGRMLAGSQHVAPAADGAHLRRKVAEDPMVLLRKPAEAGKMFGENFTYACQGRLPSVACAGNSPV
jgi:hypothetical protein